MAGKSNNFVTFLLHLAARPGANMHKKGHIMNHNLSSYARKQKIAFNVKNRVIRIVCAGIALFAVFSGTARAVDPFLPDQFTIFSTVPPNGDVNPYGVAFVPQGFQSGTGPLRPGHVLVSNFNNKMNLQGTGTTIVRVSSSGQPFVFFAGPPHPGGSTGLGLSTALAI